MLYSKFTRKGTGTLKQMHLRKRNYSLCMIKQVKEIIKEGLNTYFSKLHSIILPLVNQGFIACNKFFPTM